MENKMIVRRRSGNAFFLVVLLLFMVISLTAGCKGSREGDGPADPGNGGEDTSRENTQTPPRDPSPVPGEEDKPDLGDLPDPPPDP